MARGRILNVDVIQPDAAFIPNILTVQRYIGYQIFSLLKTTGTLNLLELNGKKETKNKTAVSCDVLLRKCK